MTGRARARQVVLVVAALVFTAIGVASAIAPHTMADGLGYTLRTTDALSEFRAVYVGVWLATAALLVVAARRIDQPLLGDLGALLILGQTAGRILSLALDGAPSANVAPIAIAETAGGIAILVLRPTRRA